MTSISLPDETFDITVTRTLPNLQTNEVKRMKTINLYLFLQLLFFDYLDA